MHRKLTFGAVLASVVVVAVAVASGAAASSAHRDAPKPSPRGWSAPTPTTRGSSSGIDQRAAVAFAAQKGISVAEARARLGRQPALGKKGSRIALSLAGRTGGSYLDSNGELVVTTLDAKGAALVRRSGARARLVDDSSARLASIMNRLNQLASTNGAGAVQGWYVDVPRNSVVVTVTRGATDARTVAMKRLASGLGRSARIEYRSSEQAPHAADWLVGGYEFLQADGIHVCSVGFNTLDALNRNVVLTAGHCVKASGTTSRNGYWIGKTRTADFPSDDFGTFWNSYPSFWQPSVSVYLYNGRYVNVAGQWDNPPVGATVCKSGRTTGYTCGTITALNQTVVYPEGTVSGLVRHTACVEGGDSGGANISAGYYALGVTSGASTTLTGLCRSKVGSTNISYYQPIGEALTRNGLQLLR